MREGKRIMPYVGRGDVPVGVKFNWITVIGLGEPRRTSLSAKRGNKPYLTMTWRGQCICGDIRDYNPARLKSGANKSCGCKRPKVDLVNGSFNDYFKMYRTAARTRSLTFEITKEQFREITSQNCHYCDVKPSNYHYPREIRGHDYLPYVCNGIDRKNSKIGYVLENCLPCCEEHNTMKMAMGYDEFIESCRRVVRRAAARDLEKLVDYDPSKSYV